MNIETRHVRYIFADVVRFTEDRTLEAQVEIIQKLNAAFRRGIADLEAIFLPTGDGICVGILQADVPADIHLTIALSVLSDFHSWSEQVASNRRAEIRIAINESVDAVVIDINGNRNLAGVGINSAQRLMSISDGNQIIVGRSAYESLRIRDQYHNSFREFKAEVKHGRIVTAFQFIALNVPFLNIEIPNLVQNLSPIDVEMTEDLDKPGGGSTFGMVDATRKARAGWEDEMQAVVTQLKLKLTDDQQAALDAVQKAWKKFFKSEIVFIGDLRDTVHGTMYNVIGADILTGLVKKRTLELRGYLREWVGENTHS